VLCWIWGATLVFDGDGFAGRRRLAAGGAVFGFAVSIKLSALIPLLVVLVLCLPQLRRRAIPFAASAVAGCAIPMIPFLVVAPAALYRDVVTTQLGRIPASGRVPIPIRLGDITGVSAFASGDTAAIAAALALAGVVAAVFILSRRRPASFEWFALGSIAALAVAQLAPAQYYPHYAAVIAPFLAILLAVSLERAAGRRARPLSVAIAAAGVTVVLVVQIAHLRGMSTPDVVRAVDSVIPAGGCAVSDAPRNLVTTDRFVATVSGCTNMTDPAGTMLALDDSSEASTVWHAVFDRVDYVVTETPIRSWSIPGTHPPTWSSTSGWCGRAASSSTCAPAWRRDRVRLRSQDGAELRSGRGAVVGAIGIEPMTSAMSTQRSYHLSYAPARAAGAGSPGTR
jgi:hypothetical protein